MSTDEVYTIKEMLDRVEKKLDTNTSMTSELNLKVATANGRTRKLEDWSNEAKLLIEDNIKAIDNLKEEYKSDKALIHGGVRTLTYLAIAIPVIVTSLFTLYFKNRDYIITQEIQSSQQQTLAQIHAEISDTIQKDVNQSVTSALAQFNIVVK